MGGMTQERLENERNRCVGCPSLEHPSVSTLYLDHPSWYQAAALLSGTLTVGVRTLGIREGAVASEIRANAS